MRYEDDAVSEEDEVVTESAPLSDAYALQTGIEDEVTLAQESASRVALPEAILSNQEYSAELLTTKTLDEFIALLYEHEDFRGGEPLLGVSAGEFENACESFIAGIFIESIEQSWFPADDVIAHKIDRFTRGLGLPNAYQLHEHLSRLIRARYEQKKVPDMISQLRSETVHALNETKTIEEFEHTLYEELPPERASYISRRLQHILQGTAVHFADGIGIRREPGASEDGTWWNDPTAEAYLAKILREYAPLPYALDREHLAHLLLDWTFREEGLVIPQPTPISPDMGEAERIVTGMEEFDELRPPKKSADEPMSRDLLEM